MPLEIKELHIKATVSDDSGTQSRGEISDRDSGGANEEIVVECVEKVMEILNEKLER